jgi:phosphatidylinositol alpha-1,6-mannosyltransferase
MDVQDRVMFLGAVDSPTLAEIYRAADLFVMPSTGEGFGVAFLEAMASGTPALGLGVAGSCDALGDGELGSTVAEVELSGAIARILDGLHPDRAMLAAAVLARFGRNRFKDAARSVLSRLVAA